MIDLLRAAAACNPDHPALVTDRGQWTWSELLRRAQIAGHELRQRDVRRFAVIDPDPAVVWPLLAGAAAVGAEACVYPIAAPADAVEEMRERFAHDTVVTSRELAGALEPHALFAGAAEAVDAAPDDVRLLVLTTGTSGVPKAALHDWSRLLRVADRIVPTPEHRWLLAYGLNQFGGLQILIHAAAAQVTLAAAEGFQPRPALAAMRRWDVTHASGTPTFWRFVLAELRADGGPVPALQQVTLSGEAVPGGLLDRLRETFAGVRISQIYAATEMGQGITVRDGLPGLPASMLRDSGDVQLKIVEGELYSRTRSAMLGYFDLSGRPVSAEDSEGWRPTGDLVEVVGDRIEFRGRLTDVINVGGVKVHPLPIEERAGSVEGVAAARAFGRPNPLVGSIVMLDIVPVIGVDEDALHAAVRAACADLPPAARPRTIRFVASLETAGNKLTRRGRG